MRRDQCRQGRKRLGPRPTPSMDSGSWHPRLLPTPNQRGTFLNPTCGGLRTQSVPTGRPRPSRTPRRGPRRPAAPRARRRRAASSRSNEEKSVSKDRYLSSRATFVCFAFARPRPIVGRPPRTCLPRLSRGSVGRCREAQATNADALTKQAGRAASRGGSACCPNRLTGSRVPEPPGATEPQTQAGRPRSASSRMPSSTASAGSTTTIPTPMFSVASRSALGDPADRLDQVEDRRRCPAGPVDPHLAPTPGIDPGQVVGQPAAGDVADRVHLDRVDQRQAVGGVDPGGLEQLLAEGPAELGHVSVQASSAATVEEDVPDQRVAVGVQPGGGAWRPPRRRARPGPAPRILSRSTTPVAAPATSYSPRLEQPGMLGGLPADQGAAGLRRTPSAMPLTMARSAPARPGRRRCSRS